MEKGNGARRSEVRRTPVRGKVGLGSLRLGQRLGLCLGGVLASGLAGCRGRGDAGAGHGGGSEGAAEHGQHDA